MKKAKILPGNTPYERLKCQCGHSRGAHDGSGPEHMLFPGRCFAAGCDCKEFKLKYEIPLPGNHVNNDDDVPF